MSDSYSLDSWCLIDFDSQSPISAPSTPIETPTDFILEEPVLIPSASSQDTVDILHIPPIVDLICDNLSQEDIQNCHQVSTEWHDEFGSHRDRNDDEQLLDSSVTQPSDILEDTHLSTESTETIPFECSEYLLCSSKFRAAYDIIDDTPSFHGTWEVRGRYEYDDWPIPMNHKTSGRSKKIYTRQPQGDKHIRRWYRARPLFLKRLNYDVVELHYELKSEENAIRWIN
ncbi:hypothetical protein BGZ49_002676 [Haplosporangium sp. Z 27]|nr:hypothetical protein BGZ49_002676 [Haplosporangium sp. Z 27]